MTHAERIAIGFKGRFSSNNWRPIRQEVTFARHSGFRYIQFSGPEAGLDGEHLGGPLAEAAQALDAARVHATLEILLRVDAKGETASGLTPLEVLKAHLPAIRRLRCSYVHWHLVPVRSMDEDVVRRLERSLVAQFEEAVALAATHGFLFGFENNEPGLCLFSTPQSCADLLTRVLGLTFVWDLNHTVPADVDAFKTLVPSVSVVHVSDTPLPEVNHHLPLGLGTLDLAAYFSMLVENGFAGPVILEIGGFPKSGGYGRDTDAALADSYERLTNAIQAAGAGKAIE